MGEPVIYIDLQKAHDLDRHLALQKIYYRPEGLYQNVKGLWDACKKASYSFPFIDIKKWLEGGPRLLIIKVTVEN